MNPPLISVITPTFNSGAKIAATVASVLSQQKGLYEFLVIDGGSTDGTLAHLRAQGPALRYVSEPDEGIYDAMNKGIRLTSGKFLYFLGAGDRLLPGVLEAVAAEIRKLPCQGQTSQPTLLYGNVTGQATANLTMDALTASSYFAATFVTKPFSISVRCSSD